MQIFKSCEKFSKNSKNSNFLQNFLNPCKKFKKKFKKNLKKNLKNFLKNPNFSQQKFTNSKKFQKFSNFFENSFFYLLAVGGGALYY